MYERTTRTRTAPLLFLLRDRGYSITDMSSVNDICRMDKREAISVCKDRGLPVEKTRAEMLFHICVMQGVVQSNTGLQRTGSTPAAKA